MNAIERVRGAGNQPVAALEKDPSFLTAARGRRKEVVRTLHTLDNVHMYPMLWGSGQGKSFPATLPSQLVNCCSSRSADRTESSREGNNRNRNQKEVEQEKCENREKNRCCNMQVTHSPATDITNPARLRRALRTCFRRESRLWCR